MHHLSRLRHVSPVLARNMQTRFCPTFFLGAISVQHPNFSLAIGNGPIVAAALHAGHQLRSEVEAEITLCPADRLREEDPYTDRWTQFSPTRLVVHTSRFQVDLNRPRGSAVYRTPADAWGLQVWRDRCPDGILQRSRAEYDSFYGMAERVFDDLARRYGRFVVYDLHTYNHRRNGPNAPPSPQNENPDVNLGTGSLDRSYWAPLVHAFTGALPSPDSGQTLDVRENVKFQGGHFARWVHAKYPHIGCVLSIEVKKTFMDEWTGVADPAQVTLIRDSLAATVDPVLRVLHSVYNAQSA